MTQRKEMKTSKNLDIKEKNMEDYLNILLIRLEKYKYLSQKKRKRILMGQGKERENGRKNWTSKSPFGTLNKRALLECES